MESVDPGFRALAGLLARMQKDLRSQGRASQAAFRSVETAQGPVRYYGSDGEVLGEIAAGPGGIEVRPSPNVPPLTPTAPDAVGVQGGIVVKYDGTFLGGNWSSTLSHVEIHRASVNNFTPNDQTLIGTFSSYWGGEFWTAATPFDGPQFFRLVAVDRAGGRSAPSGSDSATALATHVGSDGEAPEVSPAPVVRGGVGALFVSWTPVGNEDPVDYYVHISTVNDFVPSAGTLVAETAGSSVVLKTMPNGDPLMYDTIYYVKIIAEDVDGAAPASLQGGDSMLQVTGDDIAVNYVYAGNILADQITGGTIQSVVTIAGLIKTAETGGRVEIGPFGVRVYDANGIDINVDLGGLVNRFRGSIDAVDLLVRDGLELFGQNNSFGPNSIVTLRTGQSGSNAAPTVNLSYEPFALVPNLKRGYHIINGFHSDGNGQSGVGGFFSQRWLYGKNGSHYEISKIRSNFSNGEDVPMFQTGGMAPIVTGAGQARVATITTYAQPGMEKPPYGVPPTYLMLWDDSPMTVDATTPPIPKMNSMVLLHTFSFFRNTVVGRAFESTAGGGDGTYSRRYSIVGLLDWGVNPDSLIGRVYTHTDDNTPPTIANSVTLNFDTYRVDPDEGLSGIAYGSAYEMKFFTPTQGADINLWVFFTTHQVLVFDVFGTRRPDLEFPTNQAPGATHTVAANGDIATNEFTEFVSMTYAGNAPNPATVTKYSNWTWVGGASDHHFSYAWRGKSDKAPEWLTEPSPVKTITPIKRGRLQINIPPLPPPEAGQNMARDPNKDIYGWVLYGSGAGPLNNQMQRQNALSPAGDPTVINTAIVSGPLAAGANPVLATQGFPNLSPAKIVSSASVGGVPLLTIDGEGNFGAKNATISDDIGEALLGKAFKQAFAMDRIRAVITGGGNRTSIISGATGIVKWSQRFLAIGWNGFDPDLTTQGHFQIDFPAVGTVIPVHSSPSRNSLVVGSTGITLNTNEGLYYEIPFGANKNSQPGRFHVIEFNEDDDFEVPPNWVLIVVCVGEYPWFRWGDNWTKEDTIGRYNNSYNMRPFQGLPPNSQVYTPASWALTAPDNTQAAEILLSAPMAAPAGVAACAAWLEASYDNTNWIPLANVYNHNNGQNIVDVGPTMYGKFIIGGGASYWIRLRAAADAGGNTVLTMYANLNITYTGRRG